MASDNETVAEIVKYRLHYLDGAHSAWVSESVENARDFVLELLEAHEREVAELYAIIEKSQKDAETYRDERDGAMTHWREEKAKVAELRECLKEAMDEKCRSCKAEWYGQCVTKDGGDCELIAKWRKALGESN